MPEFSERARDNPLLDFVDSCLRGVGQVCFMNNPVTGLLILAAILVGRILIEAAETWRQAGEGERAVALLEQAVAEGGEDVQHARVCVGRRPALGPERAAEHLDRVVRRRLDRPAAHHPAHDERRAPRAVHGT